VKDILCDSLRERPRGPRGGDPAQDITIMQWNPDDIRRFGARVADIVAEYYAALEAAPIGPRRPDDLPRLFDAPLPEEGTDPFTLLAEVNGTVIPNSLTIPSPRYFGLFNPTPTVIGVYADAIASLLNQNMAAWSHGPAGTEIEAAVMRWLCGLLGLPDGAFGTLTSGGTIANYTGLKVALNESVPGLKERGVAAAPGHPILYVSTQAHYSIDRLGNLLGIGTSGVRKIPCDDRARIRMDLLRERIAADRSEGRFPFCVIGIAGTTTSGAVDPLEELADLCAQEKLWYHVDAAWGGAARLSRKLSPLLSGIERADSVTLDPHKWFSVPFVAGAIVTRDGMALRRTFEVSSLYLSDRFMTAHDSMNLYQYGVAGSRRLDALKVWLSMRQYGRKGYEEAVERQVALAERLARQVSDAPDMEPLAPSSLGCFLFRHTPAGFAGSPADLDSLHLAIQDALMRRSRIWISTSLLNGRRAFRFCATSYLSREQHVDEVLPEVRAAAREVS